MIAARRRFVQALAMLPWIGAVQAQAPIRDLLGAISDTEATQALRDSLESGARQAIASLGRENGFFGDPKLKIGLPKNFTRAEKFLRSIGYGRKVDDLVLAMNRAAEAATPKALNLLLDAIKQLRVSDAKAILTGGDTAATQYFRKTTERQLSEMLKPLIKSVTEHSDLARSYNNLAGTLDTFGVTSDQDMVERYVNKKTLEGIYHRIGELERSLRADPTQYAGTALGKVFSLLK